MSVARVRVRGGVRVAQCNGRVRISKRTAALNVGIGQMFSQCLLLLYIGAVNRVGHNCEARKLRHVEVED